MEYLADTFNAGYKPICKTEEKMANDDAAFLKNAKPPTPLVQDEEFLNQLFRTAFILGYREGKAEGWNRAMNAIWITSYRPPAQPPKQEEIQNGGDINPDFNI